MPLKRGLPEVPAPRGAEGRLATAAILAAMQRIALTGCVKGGLAGVKGEPAGYGHELPDGQRASRWASGRFMSS